MYLVQDKACLKVIAMEKAGAEQPAGSRRRSTFNVNHKVERSGWEVAGT